MPPSEGWGMPVGGVGGRRKLNTGVPPARGGGGSCHAAGPVHSGPPRESVHVRNADESTGPGPTGGPQRWRVDVSMGGGRSRTWADAASTRVEETPIGLKF